MPSNYTNKEISVKTKPAFTMAEILLSLTIIGVVAAITLPSLTGNINERTWNTQRKALYARMSQAVALLPSVNGYGTYSDADSSSGTSETNTFAESFVTEGLSKVLKINNVCDYQHLTDCGLPEKYANLSGSISNFPTDGYEIDCEFYARGSTSQNPTGLVYPRPAAFETQNGESIAVFYRNFCNDKDSMTTSITNGWTTHAVNFVCAHFIYDLNGTKGPNTIGKDMGFMTLLYPSDSQLVAPLPLPNTTSAVPQADAGKACTALDTDSRAPNLEEAISLSVYGKLSNGYWTNTWTTTRYSTNKAWFVDRYLNVVDLTTNKVVSCIKK